MDSSPGRLFGGPLRSLDLGPNAEQGILVSRGAESRSEIPHSYHLPETAPPPGDSCS